MNVGRAPASQYEPRYFTNEGVWPEGDSRFKCYSIGSAANRPPTRLLAAARGTLSTHVKEIEAEPSGHRLGFIILHCGIQGIWLQIAWWAHDDIYCAMLFHANDDDPVVFKRLTRFHMACVWELRVVDHERQAWIDCLLSGRPDPERYIGQVLPEGWY